MLAAEHVVESYLGAAPARRRGELRTLHDRIRACFPTATVDMRYRMPTYALGEGWVSIANQRSYVSLYTCSAAHLEAFRREYPEIGTGKGCIRFRERDPIPEDAVDGVIRHAMLHPKG